jgi:undecaprenyl-phosphate 4-deoxy-4-formamido-L-arabinose transferase
VPVFNGAATLTALVERCTAVLVELAPDHEIVLVNDGSEDESRERIESLQRRYPQVRGIDLERNRGQHEALLVGIRAARGDVIVTMDDDLQNPPEEMPRLLAALEGNDVAYGTPRRKSQSALRNLAGRGFTQVLRGLGWTSAPMVSSYRAFRGELRDAFAGHDGRNVSIDALLTWGASRYASVPVEHAPRAGGRSNYDLVKLMRLARASVTTFRLRPR